MAVHPEFNYVWTNPVEPDPISLIEKVGAEIVRERLMREATPLRNTCLGNYFERTRTLDELGSVIYEETRKPISLDDAKKILAYFDGKDIPYDCESRKESGFLRFEQIGKEPTHFRVQDFSWACLAA